MSMCPRPSRAANQEPNARFERAESVLRPIAGAELQRLPPPEWSLRGTHADACPITDAPRGGAGRSRCAQHPPNFFSIVLPLEGNDWFLRLPRLRRRTSAYAVLTVRLHVAPRPPPSSVRRSPSSCTPSPASVRARQRHVRELTHTRCACWNRSKMTGFLSLTNSL
jgi:hypothetical protein